MQTEDLILWVDKAIELRESSFEKRKKFPAYFGDLNNETMGHYKMSINEALFQTEPENVKQYDKDIALWMIEYGNDIVDWKKQIEKDKNELPRSWENYKDKILSSPQVVDHMILEKEHCILIDRGVNVSRIKYYPKSNRVHIVKINEWKNSGLDWLIKNLL